ncbi:hypothetical protein VQ03_10125 [Methylobacterium tarhaniae]|uniref:Uncharacterized protein n=1 Tax=Methylobacterium tarhaniae TaxID=1187852 RepID=A0A0J6T9Y3_9HYPH|nr:hypothetical protein VQ03_10125 [Methylobacterium tarhaniae]
MTLSTVSVKPARRIMPMSDDRSTATATAPAEPCGWRDRARARQPGAAASASIGALPMMPLAPPTRAVRASVIVCCTCLRDRSTGRQLSPAGPDPVDRVDGR